MRALGAIASLSLANYIYQCLTGHRWDVAFERSFFQATGVLIYAFIWEMTK